MSEENIPDKLPESTKGKKIAKGALQVAGGAIPFAGGLLSAVAGAWSEKEQEEVNKFFEYWIKMIQDEIKEKEVTMIEILARLDMHDKKIKERVKSKEYQSLVKKTFREWSGAESDEKRKLIRNILANAAATDLSSDDVIKLFIDWINDYSDLHFQVIGAIYNSNGITRGAIWTKIGKSNVREDSADADLYKLLFRDLSTGGIVRQHRETDYFGNFIPKTPAQRRPKGSGTKPMTSAFDTTESYELTELGKQFVHYAMTDLPLKIEYKNPLNENE
ncbi:MAG: hypothetical protein ISS18_16075 [Bacteroidales bacterium]|nr:hypothetical protein [Bacteroidales bacterium]